MHTSEEVGVAINMLYRRYWISTSNFHLPPYMSGMQNVGLSPQPTRAAPTCISRDMCHACGAPSSGWDDICSLKVKDTDLQRTCLTMAEYRASTRYFVTLPRSLVTLISYLYNQVATHIWRTLPKLEGPSSTWTLTPNHNPQHHISAYPKHLSILQMSAQLFCGKTRNRIIQIY